MNKYRSEIPLDSCMIPAGDNFSHLNNLADVTVAGERGQHQGPRSTQENTRTKEWDARRRGTKPESLEEGNRLQVRSRLAEHCCKDASRTNKSRTTGSHRAAIQPRRAHGSTGWENPGSNVVEAPQTPEYYSKYCGKSAKHQPGPTPVPANGTDPTAPEKWKKI